MKKNKLNLLIPALMLGFLTACNEGGGAPGLQNQLSRAGGGLSLTGAASDACSGVSAWDTTTAYSGGAVVVKDGIEYKSNWWTQGDNPADKSGPSGSGQPWGKVAECGVNPSPTPSVSPAPVVSPTPVASPTPTPTTSPTPGQYQVYPTGLGSYTDGTVVQGSDGKLYQCKPYPYTGWCNSTAHAYYAPGSGSAWKDAWTLYDGTAPAPIPTVSPTPSVSPTPTVSPTPVPTTSPTPTIVPPPVTGLIYSAYKDVGINANWNNGQISTKVKDATAGFPSSIVSILPTTSMNTLTWAFATGECGSENWAGMSADQFAAQNIADFNKAGLKYIVSTGGASGAFTCSTNAGMDKFLARYMSAGFVGLDFDIEAGPSGAALQSLITQIAYAQKKYPNLRISFTLATLASKTTNGQTSLNALGDSVIKLAQAAGINFYVNLMVMDYGNSSAVCVMNPANTNCDMNLSAQQAALNLSSFYKLPLSKIELTPMIGVNDTVTNLVSLTDATKIATWAKANGLAGLHYWSWDRDASCVNEYATTTCSSSVNGTPMQTSSLQYLSSFAKGL